MDGSYSAALDYSEIKLKDEEEQSVKEAKYHDLTDTYNLQCANQCVKSASAYFDSLRPIPFT